MKQREFLKGIHTTPADGTNRLLNTKRYTSGSLRAICLSVILTPIVISGCDSNSPNPMTQNIPSDSENWQDELAETLEELSEEDRQLLSRYMQRIRLSDAHEKGAMPSNTIAEALNQQREYETLHPNNPTGEKSFAVKEFQREAYPITLLPPELGEGDSLNNVELSFILSNKSNIAIKSFKGTLLMHYSTQKEAKPVIIPLTIFDPPIPPQGSYKMSSNVSISDTSFMNAIQNPQNIEIEVTKGRLTLEDSKEIVFE